MSPDPDAAESDLRVPTATYLAEVVLSGGEALRGRFFVPAGGSWYPGPMRPEVRLNDESDFFPFLVAEEPAPVIVNKRAVSWITFDERAIVEPESTENSASASPHRVAIECDGRRLEGVLLIELPGYKSRVLDHLNEPARFVRLRNAPWVHFVNRERITKIVEVG